MKQEEVKHRIDKLNVWKQGGQRAHGGGEKIFCSCILYALGRCLRGEDRLIPMQRWIGYVNWHVREVFKGYSRFSE